MTSVSRWRLQGASALRLTALHGALLLFIGGLSGVALQRTATEGLFPYALAIIAIALGIYLTSWRWIRTHLRILELRALSLSKWEALALKHDRSGWWYILLDASGDPEKKVIYHSPALRKLLGFDTRDAEIDCASWYELIHEDDRELIETAKNKYLDGSTDRYDLTFRMRNRTGKLLWIHSTVNIERDRNGVPVAFFGIDDDVTEQVQLGVQHELCDRVIQRLGEAVMITDTERRIINVNEAFTDITGWCLEEIRGKSPRILSSGFHNKAFYDSINQNLAEGGEWSGEIIDKRKDGSYFTALMRISRIDDSHGKPRFYFSTFADVTDAIQSREKLEFLSHFDPLTGLYNSDELVRRLNHLDAIDRLGETEIALIMIDIDNFQAINDAYGKDVGDEVLRTIGHRLQRITHGKECAAHIPGDSFAALLIRKGLRESLPSIETRLISHIGAPIPVASGDITVSCTIGVALYPDVATPSDLLGNAETALHVARVSGPAQLRHYEPAMSQQIQEDFLLASELRIALSTGDGIGIALQQVVDLRNGRGEFAEVLARWIHPVLGFIPPDKFIRVAENNGLIRQLSDRIIDLACEELVQLRKALLVPPEFRFSINLSSQQLSDPGFARNLLRKVEAHGVKPMQIELELTESILMENPEHTKDMLEQLQGEGFSIAIDDFGTGYSSLAYLSLFPLDKLKVDRSFVMALESANADQTLIRMIIGLAQDLNLEVVAEGIETNEIADKVRELGAQYGQGYYFARPVSPAEFAANLGMPSQ